MNSFPAKRPAAPRRVFVTGATGFVGRHLIAHLEAARLEITGACWPERPEDCPDFRKAFPRVKLIPLDLRDAAAVEDAVASARPDRVFHLAAISQVRASWDKRRETIETNLLGTFNLFEAIRIAAPAARVLFVSSSDVYGNQPPRKMPLRESSPTAAASPYGFTKLAAESLASLYVRAEGLAIVIARPFTHTGPGQSPDFVCSDWARQIAVIEAEAAGGRPAERPILKVGNLSIRRDYSDVRDIVRAYAQLIDKGTAGEAYNICSGKSPALRTILQILLDRSRVEIAVETDPLRIRKIDIPLVAGSHARITGRTGWNPRYGLEKTLADLLAYWRARIGSGSPIRPV